MSRWQDAFCARNGETVIETLKRRIKVLRHASFDGYKSILSSVDQEKHDIMMDAGSDQDRREMNKLISVDRQKASCLMFA
jgi:hypothetical protein